MTNVDSPSTWLGWGSAAVSDALRKVGKPFQAMDAGIRPLVPEMKAAGPAFTVRCYPGATWAMEQALEHAAPGDVLVVDGGANPHVILMGGLMSTRARARGIAGAVLDAAVRDTEDIIELGFPMFSRYVCPRAGTFAEIGEWQMTICCGRLPVNPGDWVVADRNGIVLVPPDLMSQVAAEAEAIHDREQKMAEQLKAGKTFEQAADAIK